MKPLNRVYIPPIPVQDEEMLNVIRKNLLVTGPHLEQLAEELKRVYRKRFCVLTANASSALLLSMLSMKSQKLKVLMPAAGTCFSFVNATLAAGFQPVFCDVDPSSANLDTEAAMKVLASEKIDLVISPNHFGIRSAVDFFKERGLPVIEDAAQSAMTNLNTKSSANTLILSFYPTKMVNGVDGGALLTDDASIYKYAIDHVYYDSQNQYDGKVRYNLRMPNLHAFLALKSLTKIDKKKEMLDVKADSFRQKAAFAKLSFLGSASQFTPFRFVLKMTSEKRRDDIDVFCRQHKINCGKELMLIAPNRDYPVAEMLTKTTLAIPFHEEVGETEADFLFKTLRDGTKHS